MQTIQPTHPKGDLSDSGMYTQLHRQSHFNTYCYVSDEVEIVSMGTGDNVANVDLPVSATTCLAPDVTKAKFPSTFYAVDIYRAFKFTATKKLMVEAWFEQFFQVPYKTSTFYAHRAQWFSAPLDARICAITAGYSKEGCYSIFMRAHLAKNADITMMQRKLWALDDD